MSNEVSKLDCIQAAIQQINESPYSPTCLILPITKSKPRLRPIKSVRWGHNNGAKWAIGKHLNEKI